MARSLMIAILCACASLTQTIGFVTDVYANGQSKQIIKIGSLTLQVPSEWLRHFEVNLVSGDKLVSEPSDAEYVASLVHIGTRNLDTLPYLKGLRLPGQIALLAIPADAQPLYQERLQNLLSAINVYRAEHPAADGEILKMGAMSHIVLGSESEYRLGQPLVVDGLLTEATAEDPVARVAYARYRIAPDVSIRLQFDLREFPPEKWMEMDRDVQELISFLKTMPE